MYPPNESCLLSSYFLRLPAKHYFATLFELNIIRIIGDEASLKFCYPGFVGVGSHSYHISPAIPFILQHISRNSDAILPVGRGVIGNRIPGRKESKAGRKVTLAPGSF